VEGRDLSPFSPPAEFFQQQEHPEEGSKLGKKILERGRHAVPGGLLRR